MNPLQQFTHILFKDFRGHWPEIGVVLLLNLVLTLMLTQSWTESFDSTETPFGLAAQMMLVVAWCLLIGRVAQVDGVAGKAPYWLTRPGSRPALLASKLALVLLTVHLPSLLSQLAIVIGSGVPLSLPQLLLNQVVFAAFLSLPLMAIAALTTNISRFAFACVAVAALSLFVVGLARWRNSLVDSGAAPFYTGSTTFRVAAEIAILTLIASVALACQYRWRSALRVAAWSLAALVLLGAGMLALPVSYVQRARAVLMGPPTVAPTIRLRDVSERRIYSPEVAYIPLVVSLPIEVPDPTDVLWRYYEVQVRSADGTEVPLLAPSRLLTRDDQRWLDLPIAEANYEAWKDRLVSVRLIVEMETYAIRATEPIPLDGSYVIVDGRAQCGMFGRYVSWSLSCRTSFGWSRWFLDRPTEAQLLWLPLRLRFAINPIERVPVGSGNFVDPLRVTEIATVVREPVSYTRQDVTFENVRLGDWGP